MKPIRATWILAACLQLMLLVFSASVFAQEKSPDQTFVGLAAEGAALIAGDPQANALRKQQPDDAARVGFDIGIGWAARDRPSRPGRRSLLDSLSAAERVGFDAAVAYTRSKSSPNGNGK